MQGSDKRHRVVITGMGIVCPLSHDVEAFWKALMDGECGIDKTTIFDASTFPTTFSAEVKDYDLSRFVKNTDLHKHANRGALFALGAAAQACGQAGLEIESDQPQDGVDRRRMGIYI